MRCALWTVFVSVSCLGVCSGQGKNGSTRVDGVIVVPKKVATFTIREAELRLYEYDPRLADARAKLIEKMVIEKFDHTLGKKTMKKFVIGKKGKLNPARSYYVTMFILKNKKRTHIGQGAHRKGLCTVLTRGQPRKIKIVVREIKR